jgi:hypothetical protein
VVVSSKDERSRSITYRHRIHNYVYTESVRIMPNPDGMKCNESERERVRESEREEREGEQSGKPECHMTNTGSPLYTVPHSPLYRKHIQYG